VCTRYQSPKIVGQRQGSSRLYLALITGIGRGSVGPYESPLLQTMAAWGGNFRGNYCYYLSSSLIVFLSRRCVTPFCFHIYNYVHLLLIFFCLFVEHVRRASNPTQRLQHSFRPIVPTVWGSPRLRLRRLSSMHYF
jgi:hypothetical protein